MGMIGETIDMRTTILGTLALTATVALAGCGSAEAGGAAASEEFVRVINVEVASIGAETFVEEIRLTSVAMANQDVMVAAEESGVVRQLFADRGGAGGGDDVQGPRRDACAFAELGQGKRR